MKDMVGVALEGIEETDRIEKWFSTTYGLEGSSQEVK